MKALNINGAPNAIGPYSHAVVVDKMLYVSGQLGINPETGLLVEGLKDQTLQALNNLKLIIEGAGFTLEGIVKATIYMKNMDDFKVVNEIYGTFLNGHKPARVAIEVAKLPMNGLFEIDAIVYKK